MRDVITGFEQITGLSSVKTLTIPAGTHTVWLQAEGQNVRFRMDGTDPTASVGQILYDNHPPLVLNHKQAMAAAKFIEEGASAKLNVHYFGGA